MIGQIGYLGKVSLRTGMSAALMYTLGATVGAALVGLALGGVGAGLRWLLRLPDVTRTQWTLLPVAALSLIGGLRDLRFFRFRLPQPARQVPRAYLEVFGPHRAGFLWGLAVGLYFQTMVQYCLHYVLALWLLVLAQPLLGAAAMTVYGLAQGLLLVVDVLAMASDNRRRVGLLGAGRTPFFFSFGGAILLACAIFLFHASTEEIFRLSTQPARTTGSLPQTALLVPSQCQRECPRIGRSDPRAAPAD